MTPSWPRRVVQFLRGFLARVNDVLSVVPLKIEVANLKKAFSLAQEQLNAVDAEARNGINEIQNRLDTLERFLGIAQTGDSEPDNATIHRLEDIIEHRLAAIEARLAFVWQPQDRDIETLPTHLRTSAKKTT